MYSTGRIKHYKIDNPINSLTMITVIITTIVTTIITVFKNLVFFCIFKSISVHNLP